LKDERRKPPEKTTSALAWQFENLPHAVAQMENPILLEIPGDARTKKPALDGETPKRAFVQ
jgi:hypothetical protein